MFVKWWTEAEDNYIRYMAQHGYYAIDCVKELGRSRNSILGRAHRLGIIFRNGNHGNKNHAPRPPQFYRKSKQDRKSKQAVRRPPKHITWGRFWGPRYY